MLSGSTSLLEYHPIYHFIKYKIEVPFFISPFINLFMNIRIFAWLESPSQLISIKAPN